MHRRARETLIELTRPLYFVVRFIAIAVDKILFGWLYVLEQRRADRSLRFDLRVNLHFLFPQGTFVSERWYRLLPFDFAAVRLNFKNISFHFARGLEQLNVSLAPKSQPLESFEFCVVLAALDSSDISAQKPIRNLNELGEILRPRLEAINDAYSERAYPEFRERLIAHKKEMHILAKETEWNLNKQILR